MSPLFHGWTSFARCGVGILCLLWPSAVVAQESASQGRFADQLYTTPATALRSIELPREHVERYSQALLQAYLRFYQVTEASLLYRGERVDYIRSIVATLDDNLDRSEYFDFIRVRAFEANTPIAHALPSGILLVSHSLVQVTRSEDALAGALAHELSHLDLGHVLRIPRAMVHQGRRIEELRPSDWTDLITHPYTLDEELAADASALRWLRAAGWDPALYGQYLLRRSKDQRFAQRWFHGHLAPALFLSELKHPELERRLQAMRQQGVTLAPRAAAGGP
ncbi:MAG: hypothetical protein D6753_01035 [Planctomycetota bacterium]|nr:MAG: hypothetical protein D6753_01035 [Planctomycetota bacterium]